nr:unnamed protein product [Callosobruchus chinensis]
MENDCLNQCVIGNDSILEDVIPATPGVYRKPRKYRKKVKCLTTEKESQENDHISTAIKFTPYDYDSLARLNFSDNLKLQIPIVGSFYGPRDFSRPFVYIDNEEIIRFDKTQLYKIYKVHLMGFYTCEENMHRLLPNMQTKNQGIKLIFMSSDNFPITETFISVFGYVDFINNDLDSEIYIVVKFFREESMNDVEKLRYLSKSMSGEFALDTSPASPATLALAEKELRETPEIVSKALAELRELLKNDDTIYFKDDDETLIMYLRPCKFYAESAHKLMKRIADFKESHKDILENLLPEDEKTAFTEHNVVNVLKNRDHKGTWDPSKVTPTQLFRIFFLIHEVAVLEPETQINGCVVIMDFNGLGMKQVKAFSPSFSLLLLSFIQDAMPLRLKEVHMVKQPFVFNIVWNIFKPFIKEKLKGRPSHLPKDYDGELPMLDYGGKDWYPVVDRYLEHIKVMNSFGKKKH